MANGVFTPYSSVAPYLGALPPWVPTLEQERVKSYNIYEQIFWNAPETFKLVVRGTENNPIYIPTARTIIETTNRYVGKRFGFMPDPAYGSSSEQQALTLALTDLFSRERFLSKYNANKRYGLIRGDWLWHITANPAKPEGTRLNIYPVDPASYFTVPYEEDQDRIFRVYLAEQWVDPADDKVYVKRQMYERQENGQILSACEIYELDAWYDFGVKPVKTVTPPTLLPPQITAFPVYHIPNFDEPGNPYGSSEIRGLERIMGAINQSISDEDIALALEGLGVYATEGGGPVDDDGNPTDWIIGPGRVVENAPGFQRVNGVGSVQPFQDHLGFLIQSIREASATPDAAIGKVDVQVAESGVALALQLGPMLDKAEEKDQVIKDIHAQMFFDLLTMWLPTFERQSFGEARAIPTFGDKMPLNRTKEVELVATLMSTDPPVLSAMTAREHLAKYGIQVAPDELDRIVQEKQLMADTGIPADGYGERLAAEGAAAAGANGQGATESAGG